MAHGTGERSFWRFKGKMRPKSLLASEAVPSMSGARQDQFSPTRSARLVQRGSNVGGLGDSHGSFLRGPKEREIDPFGQGLGGELGRLVTRGGGAPAHVEI
jgi:hypothetical protein